MKKENTNSLLLKPAAYPGRTDPAHIHITIKEPDKSEYYIDDFLFDDDPLLIEHERVAFVNVVEVGL